jgi:hypothetical protein
MLRLARNAKLLGLDTTGKDFSRVKPSVELFAPRAGSAVSCPVAGFGIVRAAPDLVGVLRRNPVPPPGTPLPVSFLKHADDQTVAGLAAVYQAILNHDLAGTNFTNWGVVAAPSFLGRASLAHTLKRLAVEGAWGVSPHLIPHHSLHAVSGTVSQALSIRGPNFGIGGGPNSVAEALAVAATLVSDCSLPGLWLVLTEYETELIPPDPSVPSPNGHHAGPLTIALALALVPRSASSMGIQLDICPHAERAPEPDDWTAWPSLHKIGPLAAAFSQDAMPQGRWRFGLSGWVKLTSSDSAGENVR